MGRPVAVRRKPSIRCTRSFGICAYRGCSWRALVGASLGCSGAAMQGLFRNPLADPYLLGVASGASFGATLAMTLTGQLAVAFADVPFAPSSSETLVPILAFLGAIGAVFATLALTQSRRGAKLPSILLAGVVVGSVLTSLTTYLILRDADRLRAVFSWTLGNLATASWPQVVRAAPYAAAGMLCLYAFARGLDALQLGEDTARTLGVDARRVRLGVIIGAQPRHRGRGLVRRHHRLRRAGRAAHHAPSGHGESPQLAADLGACRRDLAGIVGSRRARADSPGRAPGRDRDDSARRAVLLVAAPEAVVTELLVARDLCVGYGARAVLTGVSLTVGAGEIVALIGPNGAGKTTLLKTLAGLLVPRAGSVQLGTGLTLAYLAQAEEVPLDWTARAVVELGALAARRVLARAPRGRSGRGSRRDAAYDHAVPRRPRARRLVGRRTTARDPGPRARAGAVTALARRADDPSRSASSGRARERAARGGGSRREQRGRDARPHARRARRSLCAAVRRKSQRGRRAGRRVARGFTERGLSDGARSRACP